MKPAKLGGRNCKAQKTLRQNRELYRYFFSQRGSVFFQDCHKFESPRWSIEALGVLPVLSARRWRLCCIHGWQRQRVVLARNPFVRPVAILQADTCGHYTIDTFFFERTSFNPKFRSVASKPQSFLFCFQTSL